MKWATLTGVRLDRTACVWLIQRHIDPAAELAYVDRATLAEVIGQGALPFHATTSEGPDPGERTSFDMLLAEYKLDQHDPALVLMAEIVHGAETNDPDALPESEGLRAVAKGMNALADGDVDMVSRMAPVYDALYAYCRRRVAGQGGWANDDATRARRAARA